MKLPKYLEIRGFLRFLILHNLTKQNYCGDELAHIIGSKKAGKLTPGTIYPVLKYLRENKLILLRQKGRKKIYHLTRKGKRELKITYTVFANIFAGVRTKRKY
ncbi:PadR family transcriptional regulator [Candidatus Woesearchaeota archaeon]|nr:PadR family transcriptional regulator [Candidatus Woesearchaeota archaeon]